MTRPKTSTKSPKHTDTTGRGRTVRRWIGFLIPVAALLAILAWGTARTPKVADPTPVDFTLPTTYGQPVALSDLLARGDVVLYFSMGVGCDGCFLQIPEIERGLAARGFQLVPIMVDPPEDVAAEARRFGIESPILIDADRSVSAAYGMLGIYGHRDRPSHSFALVRSDGTIDWVRHYPTMFVSAAEFFAEFDAVG